MQTESVTRIFLLSTLLLLPVAAHAQELGDPTDVSQDTQGCRCAPNLG